MMENKWSEGIKNLIPLAGSHHQLVPTGPQLVLISNQSIKTFKHHLISGLSSCDPKISSHLLGHLIQQEVLILNICCPSKLNPCLSAEAFLNGAFVFNWDSLTPPRTKFLIFEWPGDRRTFDQHGLKVWYLVHSPDHYRCYTVYAPETLSNRVAKQLNYSHITAPSQVFPPLTLPAVQSRIWLRR